MLSASFLSLRLLTNSLLLLMSESETKLAFQPIFSSVAYPGWVRRRSLNRILTISVTWLSWKPTFSNTCLRRLVETGMCSSRERGRPNFLKAVLVPHLASHSCHTETGIVPVVCSVPVDGVMPARRTRLRKGVRTYRF